MKFPHGMTYRLMLLTLLPAALLTFAFCAFFIYTRSAAIDRQFDEGGSALAQQLARAAELGTLNNNPALVTSSLRTSLEQPNVLRVAIVSLAGTVLHEHRRPSFAGHAPDLSKQFEAVVRDTASPTFGLSALQTTNAVAKTQLTLDKAEIAGTKQKMIAETLAVGTAVLMLLTVLALWQARRFTLPLLDLADTVRRLTAGDLRARAQPGGVAEMQMLSVGVNNLARAVSESQRTLSERVDQATQALKAQRDEASAASQAKSRFLAAASHDLRQPMHALGLFCTALARRVQEPEQKQLIGNIRLSLQAMEGLFESLLDLSRLEAGRVRANMVMLPLSDVLQWVHNEFGDSARDKGLRIRVRATDLACYADATLLRRVLMNLVSNAIRYTQTGGILIAARRRGEVVSVEVWDTGQGIDSAHQIAIFDEFVQIESAVQEKTKGLGLGLAIAQKSAALMGTRIQVRSKTGRGSVFSLELISGVVPKRVTAVREDTDRTLLVAMRALIIEDDEAGRTAMSVLLEHWACEVRSVEGAAQLPEVLAEGWSPQIIVSDYRLRANENGPDVVRAVEAACGGRQLPVVIVSGELGLDETEGTKWPTHWQYLKKPVSARALRDAMGRAVAELNQPH